MHVLASLIGSPAHPFLQPFLIGLAIALGLSSCQIVGRRAPTPLAPQPLYVHTETARPTRVILTWAGDPSTTQAVTWRTDSTVTQALALIAKADASPNFASYAETVEAESEALNTGRGTAYSHSVVFDNLEPNTVYGYRVGDGIHWSEWYHFRTASREPEPFSFIYLGDAQNNILEFWSRTIRGAYTRAANARFIVHAGDLVNQANSDLEWDEWFEAGGWIHGMRPSVPSVGNHEYGVDFGGQEGLSVLWQPHFTLPENGPADISPETAYWFDFQGVRFVVLNTMESPLLQAPWLESVLADNPNRWTIAVYHHPLFSSAQGRSNKPLQEAWKPLFDRYGVDLALQGHDHTYARGRNLPTGVTKLDEAGTVYVVSVSGPKMYSLGESAWMERSAENTQLYQIISVAEDTLQYEAYTVLDELYDAFTLVKQDDGSTHLIEGAQKDLPERRFDSTLEPFVQDEN